MAVNYDDGNSINYINRKDTKKRITSIEIIRFFNL